MNKLIPLIKIFFIFLLILSCYYILIVPSRIVVNNDIFYPVISTIFPYNEIKPAETYLVINQENYNKNLYLKLPFGGYYIIPAVLLALRKNWILVKKLTYYHLFLSLIPLIFLNKFLIYPNNLFQHLIILLGLVFTFRAFKDYLTDHQ